MRSADLPIGSPPPWDQDPTPTPHEFKIYADQAAEIFAIVDEIDYQWAIQWLWSWKRSRKSRKLYVRRSTNTGQGGIKCGFRNVYLHVEILKRTGRRPPTAAHCIADHRNGNSLDCRRDNLRWATTSQNRFNRNGKYAGDF